MNPTLRILAIGAHPDDCDIRAGGVAALYKDQRHTVKFLSVTNGESGHFQQHGEALVERRYQEALKAAHVIGAEYATLDAPDGRLMPTLELRERIIGVIRLFKPDLILTHRPNDYHPDHRYTSLLVQDASALLTVPAVCPQTPCLSRAPVIAYAHDAFQKPRPFSPDVVIDVDAAMDRKWDMLDCHVSQVYEWLPYERGTLDDVPAKPEQRKPWLMKTWDARFHKPADQYREKLIERYGEERGTAVTYAEAFEICEYGAQPTAEELVALFPFGNG